MMTSVAVVSCGSDRGSCLRGFGDASSDRRPLDPPLVLQERHGRLKDHLRRGPRKLVRRRTRPHDVEDDNVDRRPDQPHYNMNL